MKPKPSVLPGRTWQEPGTFVIHTFRENCLMLQLSANSTWGDGTWAGRWGFVRSVELYCYKAMLTHARIQNFEVVNTLRLDSRGASTNGNGTLFQ